MYLHTKMHEYLNLHALVGVSGLHMTKESNFSRDANDKNVFIFCKNLDLKWKVGREK